MTSTLAERAGASAAVASPRAAERVELALEGMTCAACAARIENTLNRLPGVEAAVNYATASARIDYDRAESGVDAAGRRGPRGVWRPRQAGRSGGACTRIVTAQRGVAALRRELGLAAFLTAPFVAQMIAMALPGAMLATRICCRAGSSSPCSRRAGAVRHRPTLLPPVHGMRSRAAPTWTC